MQSSLATFVIVLLSLTSVFAAPDINKVIEKVEIKCSELQNHIWSNSTWKTCLANSDTKILTSTAIIINKSKDLNIQGIQFWQPAQVNYVPQGLKDKFPKLKMLNFNGQSLKSLSDVDLKQFGADLEFFRASYCKLRSIMKNLFVNNPNLKYIDFKGNPLKFIESGFFENLANMKSLIEIDFKNCDCINLMETRKAAVKFKWTHKCTSDEAAVSLPDTEVAVTAKTSKNSISLNLIAAIRMLRNHSEVFKLHNKVAPKLSDDISCNFTTDLIAECSVSQIIHEQTIIDRVTTLHGNSTYNGAIKFQNTLMMFIPTNLGSKFTNLKQLTIYSTGLAKLTKAMLNEELKTLELLNCSSNILIEVSIDAFDTLTNLKTLDLSFNFIHILDLIAFEKLDNLKTLHLNDNGLKYIYGNLSELLPGNIETIDFTANDCINLSFPDNGRDAVQNTIWRDCTETALVNQTAASSNDTTLLEVAHLKISHLKTRIQLDDGELKDSKIDTFIIRDQQAAYIPYALSFTLPNLKNIVFVNSGLTRLTSDDFKGFKCLQNVKITNNNITEIDENTFDTLTCLQILDLSANNLTNLPQNIFVPLVALQSLNLTDNRITNLQASLFPPRNVIQILLVSHNPIVFFELKISKYLTLVNQISMRESACIDLEYVRDSNGTTAAVENSLPCFWGKILMNCTNEHDSRALKKL